MSARYEIGDDGEWIDTGRRIGPEMDDPESERFHLADETEVAQYMERLEARLERAHKGVMFFGCLSIFLSILLAVITQPH